MDSAAVIDAALDQQRNRIKDLKIDAEYKQLASYPPAGVYVLPQMDDIRKFHGVIFVHSGHYRDGIFRFRIDLPPAYNDVNTHPLVTFTPPVFNPLINLSTGKLELTADERMREWNPKANILSDCVWFIKNAFVCKDYRVYDNVPNAEALQLFTNNQSEFVRRCGQAVNESLQRLYDIQGPSCSLVFTEPKPVHEEVVRKYLLALREDIDTAISGPAEASLSETQPLS